MENGIQLAPQDVQYANDLLRSGICGNIVAHISRKAIQIGIERSRVLSARIAGIEALDIERAVRRSMTAEVELSNGSVFKVFLPLLNDLRGSDPEFGLRLTVCNLSSAECGGIFVGSSRQAYRLPSIVGQIDSGGGTATSSLRSVICRLAKKQRFPMAATAVVHGQGGTGVDANSNFCRRMVGVFASVRQNVDDELGNRNCFSNPSSLFEIGLGNHGAKTGKRN